MRPGSKKPDSITCLFVFVVVGMLFTTVVKAENKLFADQSPAFMHQVQAMAMPAKSKQIWSFYDGLSTAFEGGMAHVRIDGQRSGPTAGVLPKNTRFVFSMGVEDNGQHFPERYSVNTDTGSHERYQPSVYLTIGHSW